MFCNNCGNNLSDRAKFCARCGNVVERERMEDTEAVSGTVQEEVSEKADTFAQAMQEVVQNTDSAAPAVTIAEMEAEQGGVAAPAKEENEESV